ncbi:MAG: single-stranded-DNA-specific exonuclease RecJ [Campylobacterales bacterium]
MKISDLSTLEALLRDRLGGEGGDKLSELPQPSLFADMDKAADRIAEAIRSGERITIVGDYDADGVCASALLSESLLRCGGRHDVVIPDRFKDGYGLSPAVVDRIESGLVVTVDNGISAHKAALRARQKGLTLIITDHHLCPPDLPDAYAIVNPKRPDCPFPFKEPCGAAVAWYLGAALKERFDGDWDVGAQLDILLLAVLGDAVALRGMNRALARAGLGRLNRSRRPCVLALRSFLNKTQFTYEDVGYQIVPRLNAAGRMDHAQSAFEFLTAQTLEAALDKLGELDRLNRARKEIEAKLLAKAQDQADGAQAAVVAHGKGWHEGVIGIVAARLAQRYKKPAVVIAHDENGAKGSARTAGEADLFALIAHCEAHLEGFGGHKKAAGIRLEADRIEPFKSAFLQIAATVPGELLERNEALAGELPLRLIGPELWSLIKRYEPFGEGNLEPLFAARDLRVRSVRAMGRSGEHLRLSIAEEMHASAAEAVAFFTDRTFVPGDAASFYYTLSLNEFNGSSRLQMTVKEFL